MAELSIVVVNLDRDVARMAHMRRQLDRLGLRYRRLAAIQGDKLPGEFAAYFDGCALSAGEIGCYASHLRICAMIAAGEIAAPALVLEDDVRAPDDLAFLLRGVLEAAPEGWDFIRLSQGSKRVAVRVAALPGGRDLVRYSEAPFSTGAYLVSRTGAEKFIAPGPRREAVDGDLRRVWAWDLDMYGVSPPPFGADVLGASTIDALAPGVRAERPRALVKAAWRAERNARWRKGVGEFGMMRWLAVSCVNKIGRAMPRALRRRLFAWAQGALA